MCRLKAHNFLIFLFFFVSFLGQSSANTKIAPGDRILAQGDQWVRNGTEGQLGFEVIRVSSFLEFSHIKRVSDNPNLKLFIGLAQAENIRTPAQSGAGRYLSLPTDMWPGYPTLTDSARVFLNAFRDTLHNWVHNEQLDIAAIMYNLEIPFRNLSKFSPPKNSREMSQAMTVLIKEYKAKIDSVTSNTDSDIELWVFGSKGDSLDASGKEFRDPETDSTFSSYTHYGCDWEALVSPPNAIDVCYISARINTSRELKHDSLEELKYGTLEERMSVLSKDIREVKDIADRYKKPVVFQAYVYRAENAEYIPIRNSYHLFWNDYRALIKHAKSVVDSSNVDSSNSVPYGTNKPVLYWQGHYQATISTSNGNISGLSYTQDRSGAAPTGAIPWADGQTYPARLWEDGHEGDWGYNATTNYHNKWEREFIANFLSATGTPLTGHTVPASTTWRGEIYLIGDVVIPSGVTVTIQSGTVINFRPNADVYEAGSDTTISEIIIQPGGALSAVATAGDSIVFQSSFRTDGNDNPARDDWGGIRNDGGTLTLQNCIIRDAKVGVDVTSYRGKTTISETDLSSNFFGMKVREGASATLLELSNIGLYQNMKGLVADIYGTGYVALRNATIADNYQGIGFAEDGPNPTMQLKNTIVAFNTEGIYTQGLNISFRSDLDSSSAKPSISAERTTVLSPTLNLLYCDVYGSSESDFKGVYKAMPTTGSVGNVSVNPKFVVHIDSLITQSDYHLQARSPLIDAGDPSMVDPDSSRINMGRYGGTAGYTAAPDTSSSSSKSVVLGTEETPEVFAMSQNAPNPFNPETIISYVLPQSGRVRLVIYNVLGQEVRPLVDAFKPAGSYRVVWNSRDDFGRPVSSGIYLYRLAAGDFAATRKMLILKSSI